MLHREKMFFTVAKNILHRDTFFIPPRKRFYTAYFYTAAKNILYLEKHFT